VDESKDDWNGNIKRRLKCIKVVRLWKKDLESIKESEVDDSRVKWRKESEEWKEHAKSEVISIKHF
jgi:hypothetical protein